MHFLLSGLKIVMIDLLLAGDNAVVIALAVRSLPVRERRIGITGGAAAAVLLRAALTAVATRLLTISYVQIVGGILILWIALKVLLDASGEPDDVPAPKRFWEAIWYILVADLTMSTDNILAVAAAAHGNFWLIAFGLGLSIPFIVLSSNLLSNLMDRFPVLIYVGSGILGQVAGEMMMTDPFVVAKWHPGNVARYAVEAGLVAAVLVGGRWLCRRRKCRVE
jgi:YjbE family integral membrane protein